MSMLHRDAEECVDACISQHRLPQTEGSRSEQQAPIVMVSSPSRTPGLRRICPKPLLVLHSPRHALMAAGCMHQQQQAARKRMSAGFSWFNLCIDSVARVRPDLRLFNNCNPAAHMVLVVSPFRRVRGCW